MQFWYSLPNQLSSAILCWAFWLFLAFIPARPSSSSLCLGKKWLQPSKCLSEAEGIKESTRISCYKVVVAQRRHTAGFFHPSTYWFTCPNKDLMPSILTTHWFQRVFYYLIGWRLNNIYIQLSPLHLSQPFKGPVLKSLNLLWWASTCPKMKKKKLSKGNQ